MVVRKMKESYIRLIQYLLAIVIIITIAFHLQLFSSLIGPGYEKAQAWAEVASRMANPFYDWIYAVMLIAILTHSFIGVRNVLFEFIKSRIARIATSWILFIVYLIFIAVGLAELIAA
jgi:succinate dehydrogenase hydrophobic anchor subunit